MSAKIEAMRHKKPSPRVPRDLKSSYEDAIRNGYALVKSSPDHSWSEEEYRMMLGVFAPLGYDILKSE
jgi:hypothetical protein